VENCVLFRGVKVGKGAKLKNCVLLRDTKIEENATLEYVVSDKEVIFSKDTKVCGTDNYPVFVGMGARV
ncbi:MAG: glucose-1-phosphate adenylyltransferase subunit GlgD, partial [Oscillospiraceae bacterium]